jgi:hypothetical protein
VRELRRKLAVNWRCLPRGQRLYATAVLLLLLPGGVAIVVRDASGSGSRRPPVMRAAAMMNEPTPVVPTPPAPSAAPSVVTRTSAAPPTVPSPVVTPSSAAPSSGTQLETASAPDEAATQACKTYRSDVEPIVRKAVNDDDLAPATALVHAANDPNSPWSQLTSAATLASMRAPELQRHILLLWQDIAQADPSLSLTGLGSDLDAIDVDCGQAPG